MTLLISQTLIASLIKPCIMHVTFPRSTIKIIIILLCNFFFTLHYQPIQIFWEEWHIYNLIFISVFLLHLLGFSVTQWTKSIAWQCTVNVFFSLIKVLAVMLFVFFFDCKSFTLVIVAHFRSLYRSYSLFSNMMPWHLSMCQVIWNTHFGESKLTKLTCFLLKISWNYFLLYTRWEWISMINLQERENEFSLLKSLYITINTPQGYPKVKELYHKGFMQFTTGY